MDIIEKLTSAFIRFPGIGPRQARRFVSYLLAADPKEVGELADLIRNLKQSSTRCSLCGRFFIPQRAGVDFCRVCADTDRSPETLMVVEKDIDVDHINRAGVYRGGFFVLGGTIPLLEKRPAGHIRSRELVDTVAKRAKEGVLKEVIFALSTNVEGEETVTYLRQELAPIAQEHGLTLSLLGRGLSTGAEIEYADLETIKNALKNREARD